MSFYNFGTKTRSCDVETRLCNGKMWSYNDFEVIKIYFFRHFRVVGKLHDRVMELHDRVIPSGISNCILSGPKML